MENGRCKRSKYRICLHIKTDFSHFTHQEANMAIDFLVHEAGDCIGVVVVEGLKAGQELTGWVMQEDQTIKIKILNDIPIGHKLALKDLAVNDTVVKYGIDIGKVVAPIKKGEHLHVHNVKTKRW